MDKFQEIFDNPANSDFERVVFLSDTPAIGISLAGNKEVYALMTTKDLLAMLKASLPAESLAGIGWGKSVTYDVSPGIKIEASLTEEKTIRVEVIKLAKPKEEKVEQATPKKEAVVVDPELLDNLMQGDVLIYYAVDSSAIEKLKENLTKAGYEVRTSNDVNACIQALNYKDFPIVGLYIEKNIYTDPVFNHLSYTNMASRRKQFSFLVSSGVESGDPDLAYSFSVSLILDSSSIGQFESLFTKNHQSWKRLIDPFVEILEAKE